MKLAAIKKLSFRQWGWLWLAYWRLWAVQFRIKVGDGQAWLNRQFVLVDASRQVTQTADKELLQLAEKMHESVRLAARLHVWQTACLPRSIVLMQMLKKCGLQADVIIGVVKSSEQLASHAWVELDGVLIGESEIVSREFTALKH